MDMKACSQFGGQRRASLDHLRAGGVWRVWGWADVRHLPVVRLAPEVACTVYSVVYRFAILRRRALPVVHRAGQHEPHTQVTRSTDHGVVVLIAAAVNIEEVADGGDACPQHLGEGKARALVDYLGRHAGSVAIQRAVAPGEEVAIIGHPTQERLKGVIVCVQCSGYEQTTWKSLNLRGGREIARGANGDNTSVFQRHGNVRLEASIEPGTLGDKRASRRMECIGFM